MSHKEWDGGEDEMGEKGGRSQMSVILIVRIRIGGKVSDCLVTLAHYH